MGTIADTLTITVSFSCPDIENCPFYVCSFPTLEEPPSALEGRGCGGFLSEAWRFIILLKLLFRYRVTSLSLSGVN